MSPLIPLKMSRYSVFTIEAFVECKNDSFTRARKGVDLAGCITGPEAIVNVDDHHAAAATVQHPEQSRQAAKTCSVTNTGRNCDHGSRDQARYDTGQGAFHARHHDNHVRFLKRF